jgi:hypothetical protein
MAEPSRRAWETALRNDIARIEESIGRTPDIAGTSTAETRGSIAAATEEARGLLDDFRRRTPLRRMLEAGSVYDAALARVQRADEDLLLIAAPEEVIAEVPALRAGVHRYLVPIADPRAEGYLQFLNNLAARPTELSNTLSPRPGVVPQQSPAGASAVERREPRR